jgi:two-component system chemotaxis sensor kinase CheA
MDDKKQQFLARLRETFREEAAEHIGAMSSGLLALERSEGAERAAIVERVFREAHSLKGAARSVSLASVESLCTELESLFAAMKRGTLVPSTEILDAVHPALRVLTALCDRPEGAADGDTQQQERQALSALKRWAGSTGPESAVAPAVPLPVAAPKSERFAPAAPPPAAEPRSAAAIPAPPAPRKPAAPAFFRDGGASPAAASLSPEPTKPSPPETTTEPTKVAPRLPAAAAGPNDTVRVSTQKLGAILLEAEELLGAKLTAGGRAAEVRALATDLTSWNQRRAQLTGRTRLTKDDAAALAERLETEVLHSRALEHTLRSLAAAVYQDAQSLAGLADRLLDDTKRLLLLPCSHLLATLPSLVRDLARAQGKDAELRVTGEDIEIDRRVLDELKDPLIHLLRNCVDHGIEKPDLRLERGKASHGTIQITARAAEGNRVELTVADDGAGIDPVKVGKSAIRLGLLTAQDATQTATDELVNLVFHSGLSTSPILTDLSGRGLGLAIVREKVERLGGTIDVTSKAGSGTAFRILVPLSVATFRGVFVETAGRPFVLPTAHVVRVVRVQPDEIHNVENRQTMAVDGRPMSLVRLRDVLELSGADGRSADRVRPVVVVRAGDRQVAFLVDEVRGEAEVMLKGLGTQLVRVRNVAGACIAGNGAVVPILDAADLVESAGRVAAVGPATPRDDTALGRTARILIAEDSITSRTLVKGILEGAGYEVVATVDGMEALTTLKIEPFDLVVSDVDMPRMNGFELTAKIRADKKIGELPVVLVTALGSQKDREYGVEVGASAYIVKSDFDQANLLEVIRRLL